MKVLIEDDGFNTLCSCDLVIKLEDAIPEECSELFINTKKSLDNIKIPNNVKIIKIFGNTKLSDKIEFPPYIEELNFLDLNPKIIPNIKINENCKFVFFNGSNEALNNLPSGIKKLEIYFLKKPLVNLPTGLELIEYGNNFNNSIEKSQIPFGCVVRKIDLN
jgi:hypothetical protein